MAVNWGLGVPGPNTHELFQQGFSLGLQRQRENFLMEQQRAQAERQQRTEKSQARAGERIAAGDLSGARTEAAQSGNLDLVQSINQLTADQRAQAAQQAQTLAPVYHRLRQLPYEQRRAELQRVAPALAARGIPADIIGSYDPTDQNLDSDIALGMTLEQQMAQDRIRWEGVAGGEQFATDAQGRPLAPNDPRLRGGAAPGVAPGQPTAVPVQTAPGASPQATPANGYAAGVASTLAANGVPPPVIAGILGNGHHESGGWNIGRPGDGGTALGAFQWRGERAANFQRITGAAPGNATPEQTAQFVMWELQHPEQAGMTQEQAQAILSAPTPEQAALLISRYYERPNAALAHNDRRAALAAQYATQLPQQTAMAGPVPTPGQPPSIQEQAMTGHIARPAPPGYQWTEQGALRAIPGGPGDQTFERQNIAHDNARQDRQSVNQILQNFAQLQEVKDFRTARTATRQLQTLANSGTAADDVALIFQFMRVLDPNSTVREGEFATAQQTAGVPDRIRNLYNRARTGAFLTPQQRIEFARTGERLYLDRARAYNEQANNYREQLRAAGVPEAQIGRLVQTAEGPQRQDRERRQAPDPTQAVDAVRGAVGAMLPGHSRTSQGVTFRRVP